MEVIERLKGIRRMLGEIGGAGDAAKVDAFAKSVEQSAGLFKRHPMFAGWDELIAKFVESVQSLKRAKTGGRDDREWAALSAAAELFRLALKSDIQYVPGIGPARAEQFKRKNIHTVFDLLMTPPRDYQDRRTPVNPTERHAGQVVNVFARVLEFRSVRARFRRGPPRLEMLAQCLTGGSDAQASLIGDLSDERPGSLLTIVFFGQPFLEKLFQKNDRVFFNGKLELFRSKLQLLNPEFEIDRDAQDEGAADAHRPPRLAIVPVYSLTEGIGQRSYRRWVYRALDDYAELLTDPVPPAILAELDLPVNSDAIRQIHFPDSPESSGRARRRMRFEELFLYQLVVLLHRAEIVSRKKGRSYKDAGLEEKFRRSFRGALTKSQERAWGEIQKDLDRPHIMNRLLFGDVGSGKTLVAELACLRVVSSGHQAAILAPTEVLAEQHYATFSRDLEPLGIRIGLLKGSLTAAKKREMKSALAAGKIQIAVGTHALIQEDVTFHKPALFVIDEQHRFGVLQRAAIHEKGLDPDLLIMSATPIPRTLQMTLFGDLDVSWLDDRPAGAPEPPDTTLLADKPADRAIAKKMILESLSSGSQVYVIYPLIEESETLELRAATVQKEKIEKVFPKARVGLLHGRMSGEEKEKVFRAFRGGEMDILVSTTVIEVGVDVPNANLIVIENAERFGLSQLHQLRGRVGRHGKRGMCVAIYSETAAPETFQRLRIFASTHDGAKLAEEDLKLRGGGEIFGTRQWGIPDFRFSDVLRDSELLVLARQRAMQVLNADPGLKQPGHQILRRELMERYQGKIPLAGVS